MSEFCNRMKYYPAALTTAAIDAEEAGTAMLILTPEQKALCLIRRSTEKIFAFFKRLMRGTACMVAGMTDDSYILANIDSHACIVIVSDNAVETQGYLPDQLIATAQGMVIYGDIQHR